MNSDNYDFAKSAAPQSLNEYSPYVEKQNLNINDINSGIYSPSLSLVQFDLSSIYNSNGFNDTSDLVMCIPTILCASLTTGSVAGSIDPGSTTALSSLLALKSNYQHLIHQIEIVADSKVISQMTPYASIYTHFRMLSEMTKNDLASSGVSLGFSDCLDSENSMVWNPTAQVAGTATFGVGISNNRPFVSSTVTGSEAGALLSPIQNQNCVNLAIAKRVARYAESTGTSTAPRTYNKFYGTSTGSQAPFIMSADNLTAEFRPYFTRGGSGTAAAPYYGAWYDVALIPLKYFCDCIDKMGLVKRSSLVIRAYVNTGTLSVPVLDAGTTTQSYGQVVNSTFSNTVPYTVNYLSDVSANGGLPSTTTNISTALFIGKAQSTAVGPAAINFAAVPAHFMQACRMNYSTVKLDPARAVKYIEENRAKEVVYENFITNQYNNIGKGGSFSQLVQSGIKNPLGVLIVPTISASCPITVTGSTTLGFNQWQSPVDTFPATFGGPLALTNLQVTLGGVNVLSGLPLNYTFENFLQQVSIAEKLTSNDFGIQSGCFSQKWWENNRVYWVDLSRGRDADKATMRNLTISFTNQTQVPIDILVFTVYADRFVIDVETGRVSV
jgi:hypothetical protein